jgi:hypothetical protein
MLRTTAQAPQEIGFRQGRGALLSYRLLRLRVEKSQVESREHQDNANIRYQPFPESVSEERDIYTDYDGYHHRHVKHDSYQSAHFISRASGGRVYPAMGVGAFQKALSSRPTRRIDIGRVAWRGCNAATFRKR